MPPAVERLAVEAVLPKAPAVLVGVAMRSGKRIVLVPGRQLAEFGGRIDLEDVTGLLDAIRQCVFGLGIADFQLAAAAQIGGVSAGQHDARREQLARLDIPTTQQRTFSGRDQPPAVRFPGKVVALLEIRTRFTFARRSTIVFDFPTSTARPSQRLSGLQASEP